MPPSHAPDTMLYKAGYQSPADPLEFVMSSEAPDSYGDIVVQDWDLRQFKRNPIALWGHSTSQPIGTWEDVKVVDGRLCGKLKPAARGTSPTVDMVLNLLDQRILRMVSVGFRSGDAVPLDEKDPWSGYRLSGNKLLECSVVSIGANDEALRKHLRSADPALQRALSPQSGFRPCASGACAQLERAKSQASDTQDRPSTFTRPNGSTTMSLADKIKAKQDEINALRDQIAGLAAGTDETGALTEKQMSDLDDLNSRLERSIGHLHTWEATEASLARSAGGSGSGQKPAPEGGSKPAPRITARSNRAPTYNALASMAAIIKGFALRQDPVTLVRAESPDDANELEILIRAATAPAITTGATWATNLIQQSWGPMVELLRDASIYGRVPGMRVDFAQTLNLPVQNGRGALAAGFVAENGAIPVKEGSIGTVSLIPKKLGVISAYSKELARRSIPSIMQVIQGQIIGDTAEGIDTAFLDATARSTTRPAGLQDTTETGASNINAITNVATGAHGSTVKEILTDTAALLARVWAVKLTNGAWVMNPAQRLSLEDKQEGTTGEFPFRDEIRMGRFRGYPIIESTNVTAGVTAFVAEGAMGFGSELMPYFEQSDQATLHFENSSPTALTTTGSPPVAAFPAISLFQQDLVAIKGIWTLDWRILRTAGVQVLTATTGW